MPDIADLPQPPISAPVASTDVLLIGRPASAGAPPGTPMAPYAVPISTLGSAINTLAVIGGAPGTQATAPVLAAATTIVVGSPASADVVLPSLAATTRKVVNRMTVQLTVLAPLNGNVEGQAAGIVAEGGSAEFHSLDGLTWYAT